MWPKLHDNEELKKKNKGAGLYKAWQTNDK